MITEVKVVQAERAAKAKARFAKRLVEVRKAHGASTGRPDLDMMTMAADLGIEGERYRRYERGETEPPVWLLEEICDVVGITADVLIGKQRASVPAVAPDRSLVPQVAARLRAIRAALVQHVRTDADFAALCGVDVMRLESWLQGQEMPEITALAVLSEKTGINLDWIFLGKYESVTPEVAIRLQAALEGVSVGSQDSAPFLSAPATARTRKAQPTEAKVTSGPKGRRKPADALRC